ncbi:MAG: hypothetical protein WA632_13940 [Gallionella sp.]
MYLASFRTTACILFGSLLLMLIGCSANVGKTVKVSDQQIARYGTLSAEDAITELEKHVTEAMNANMQFLAPNYYRGAKEILEEVKKSAAKKPKNEVISDIAKADAILEKGNTMLSIVKSRLENELKLKIQLDKDNVSKVYPNEYESVLSDLSSLIEKVELEKADSLDKDKVELMKRMESLDVRAIQYTALHESDAINEVTRTKEGEKLAAATLAEAVRVYKDAEKRIAENPHDVAVVQQASADAMFAARHARYVNERVVALQVKVKEAVELVVQEEERLLLKISDAVGHKDYRDQPVDKQASEIAQAVTDIVQGKQKSELAIDTVNDQSKALENRLREVNDAMAQSSKRLEEKEVVIAEKDVVIAEKDTQLFEQIALLADKDAKITEKDVLIKNQGEQILQLEEQNKALLAAKSTKTKAKK